VWSYTDPDKETFYSQEISGAHRLPNGNTLICAGVHGTLFEVTPEGETVWEYVNPVTSRVLKQGESVPLDHRYHAQNAVFKVHRYALDYPAFKDRDMKPRGPLVEPPENPISPTMRANHHYAKIKPDGQRTGSPQAERGRQERRPPPASSRDSQSRERQGPGGGGNRFQETDVNKDGQISLDEFLAHERRKKDNVDESREKEKFSRIDSDRNGMISEKELADAPRGPRGRQGR
jgi:hypothetical protein